MSGHVGKSRLRDQVWHDQYTANQGEVPIAQYPGVKAIEKGAGNVRTTLFVFKDAEVPMVDEAGVVAYGSLQLYDFPLGHIYVHTAYADLTVTKSSAGVNDDWAGDFGVGTAACDNNATLTSTEDDVIPTTATTAASGVSEMESVSTTSEEVIYDGSSTAKDLYFNVLVDDGDQDVTTTPCNLILNGEIAVTWTYMGPN